MKLNKVKDYFEKLFSATSATEKDSDKLLHLAVTALMLEVAEADFKNKPEEKQVIKKIVETSFQLKGNDLNELLELAESKYQNATDSFEFTHLINKTYSQQQKIKLIDKLWQIAYADANLSKYEDQVIRRISGLIHVSHEDFIASKLKQENKAVS